MRRNVLWVVVGIAAVLVVGVGLLLLFSPAALEAAGLADEGGEVRLRDELRQPRGASRMILVALDGVGDGELRRALLAGHLPRLAGLLGARLDEDVDEHAYAVPGALTILPSTTMAAWASVFTGQPPAWTGVPGNERYQREDMRFPAPAPVTIEDHAHTRSRSGMAPGLVPIGEYLRMHRWPDLLDLEDRLEGLAVGPYGHRAGDILLLARSGMNRPIDSRFYFSQLYNSWHGSPEAEDSCSPLLIAQIGRTRPELRQQVDAMIGVKPSQLHVVPLVEALLRSGRGLEGVAPTPQMRPR